MKFLLRFLIELYWLFPAKWKSRSCLFKESCSRYVYRINQESGFWEGIKAFSNRYRQCRGGYAYLQIEEKEYVLLADHTLIERIQTTL